MNNKQPKTAGFFSEQLVPLADGKRVFPERPSFARLKNWHLRGILKKPTTEARERVFLEVRWVGSVPVTSKEAVERFFRAIDG